jgi:hypothetical protein
MRTSQGIRTAFTGRAGRKAAALTTKKGTIISIHSRLRRGAALIACAMTVSLGALTAAAPAQATASADPVSVSGAVSGAAAGSDTSTADYSIIPATDNCPSGTIVKMFGSNDGVCIFSAGTIPTTGQTFTTLVSFVSNRVWLHQNANNSGWADCFRDPFYPSSGASWKLTGSRDATPGNIQVSSNTATC